MNDPKPTGSVAETDALYRRWFRVTAHGVEHVPASGPVVVIANHAGALPIDAAMLCLDLYHDCYGP